MGKVAKDARIIVTGAAGLVGQNLCLRLSRAGYTDIVGIDKNAGNAAILRDTQPDIRVIVADLAEPGPWQGEIEAADVVFLNQAQIGGLDWGDFQRNNLDATRHILDAAQRAASAPYIVHVSSSVVRSLADDFYTRSKTSQEDLVRESGLRHCVLRPTLMFGWFDRKHLGWLRRFMDKVPVFPVPGNGEYVRQPLYAGDFCNVMIAAMEQQPNGEVFDISGREHINYIDLIRTIKSETGSRTPIVRIPYWSFFALLKAAGVVLRDPPFTVAQLRALVIPETFPITDWPERFGVRATPFAEAVRESYLDPDFADITLAF